MPALVAILALVAVLAALDPAGDFPSRPQGPGLTLDESFNVEEGVRLSTGLRAAALGAITLRELFGDQEELGHNSSTGYHNPDHPPLGRLCIGVFHDVARSLDPPIENQTPFATVSARTASVFAFAVLVFLTGWMTSRWYGNGAGTIAAVSLILMPRLFGHAHLAALESFIGLAYAAAVFVIADRWKPGSTVSHKTACLTGLMFGAALLTKIQSILIPIPFGLWALFYWRQRSLLPLILWSSVAFAIFFAFWPWLWLDPIGHLKEYFGRTTGRLPLYVWYFGTRYADTELPWHFPWVMFLTTVPLGLHLLGGLGTFVRKRTTDDKPREQLLLGCMLFPILLFSLPGIAVYDGTRLFLVAFPLWAVFIGKGGSIALRAIQQRWSKLKAIAIVSLYISLQSWGLFALHPCYLSYYNILVGGLNGAEHLGLQTTYWRDGLTRELLLAVEREVPNGATLILVPVLHPAEPETLVGQSPILRRHRVQLRRWDEVPDGKRKYMLLFHRTADIPPIVANRLEQAVILAEVRRQGVQLAALYQLQPHPPAPKQFVE